MLNFKYKGHRGRATNSKADALCVVEVKNGITRAFAIVISNKEIKTLLPIIASQVIPGSMIYSDKHKSYASLFKNGFNHNAVCHKYIFVNKTTCVHTQSVESFNKELKLMIKKEIRYQQFTGKNF
ncbi:hypothetical protein H311_00894 [Anncaliia algerae PRA109]|nr:hypothetical protein H311_00894 [Anncaliia algerae PRA109]